jgi:hypothetical protein
MALPLSVIERRRTMAMDVYRGVTMTRRKTKEDHRSYRLLADLEAAARYM